MVEEVKVKQVTPAEQMLERTRTKGKELFKKRLIKCIQEEADFGARAISWSLPYGMDKSVAEELQAEFSEAGYDVELWIDEGATKRGSDKLPNPNERIAHGLLLICW